jgi:hypothetical protein
MGRRIEKGPLKGALGHLVAGARYTNYMQIEMEPFPLVAQRSRAYLTR